MRTTSIIPSTAGPIITLVAGTSDRSPTDGYYDRFVVRQVTLDALLSRLRDEPEVDRDELIVEAATVLAGTILMASGITGWGPGAYTSDITLGSLMKPIAAYRDAYYEDRLARIQGKHAERLASEQQLRRQPFGAARQHLNAALAERRAAQLQHVQLARPLRADGLSRRGNATNRYRVRGFGANDVPDRLRDDAWVAIDSRR